MGIGKYIYWILWLPIFIISVIATISFCIFWTFDFLKELAKSFHEEIAKF